MKRRIKIPVTSFILSLQAALFLLIALWGIKTSYLGMLVYIAAGLSIAAAISLCIESNRWSKAQDTMKT